MGDFKRYKIIDHTRETFKNWECTALEVELTNYGTDYFFKVTADEKEYTVKVFEGPPHTPLSTKYKGVEGEGCVEPEPPAEEEALKKNKRTFDMENLDARQAYKLLKNYFS